MTSKKKVGKLGPAVIFRLQSGKIGASNPGNLPFKTHTTAPSYVYPFWAFLVHRAVEFLLFFSHHFLFRSSQSRSFYPALGFQFPKQTGKQSVLSINCNNFALLRSELESISDASCTRKHIARGNLFQIFYHNHVLFGFSPVTSADLDTNRLNLQAAYAKLVRNDPSDFYDFGW